MVKTSPQKDHDKIMGWFSNEKKKIDASLDKVRHRKLNGLEKRLGKKLDARKAKWHKRGYKTI